MKILRVQKNKILFENGAEFSLPKNTIREYNLKESMEITGESYMLLAESSALSFSYWLLAKRDYSTMELETKLLTKYKEKIKREHGDNRGELYAFSRIFGSFFFLLAFSQKRLK